MLRSNEKLACRRVISDWPQSILWHALSQNSVPSMSPGMVESERFHSNGRVVDWFHTWKNQRSKPFWPYLIVPPLLVIAITRCCCFFITRELVSVKQPAFA